MFTVMHKNGSFFAGFNDNETLWTENISKARKMKRSEAKLQALCFLSGENPTPVQQKPVKV